MKRHLVLYGVLVLASPALSRAADGDPSETRRPSTLVDWLSEKLGRPDEDEKKSPSAEKATPAKKPSKVKPTPEPEAEEEEEIEPELPDPTSTAESEPTETPAPKKTAKPTRTPLPTATPEPSATAEPEPTETAVPEKTAKPPRATATQAVVAETPEPSPASAATPAPTTESEEGVETDPTPSEEILDTIPLAEEEKAREQKAEKKPSVTSARQVEPAPSIPEGGASGEREAGSEVALPETEIRGELEKPDIFFLLPRANDQSDDQVIRARIRREITRPLIKDWLEESMLLE